MHRDPGCALVLLATALVLAIYAPTLATGLVNLDDTWLLADNWIVRRGSWTTILFDLDRETRFVLGAEYLPVRDLSVALDFAIWGTWYSGHHLTNVVIYIASIVVWFRALEALGIEREVAGLAVLLWALHPTHAESVAWLSERKGLLAVLLVGVTSLGYARFRVGGSAAWLGLASASAVLAVWSKALAVFALAALACLELTVPAVRHSWRRSALGLVAIGVSSLAAFAPVLFVALHAEVVSTADHAPASRFHMALGLHGFYLRLAAMTVPNAPSYPIATLGPSTLDVVLGALGLLGVGAGVYRGKPTLRTAGVFWLVAWFPISRLVFPLRNVLVADRYLLFPSIAVAIAVAFAIHRVAKPRMRWLLVAAIVGSATLRSIDARSNWRDSITLWERATQSNPTDGDAWSMYAEALVDAGADDLAFDVLREASRHTRAPRLLYRQALLLLRRGERARAIELVREAATAGDARAMANLGLLLLEDGHAAEALAWTRRATSAAPLYAHGHRLHGKVALANDLPAEALGAFRRAYRLEPESLANRFNLGLALHRLGHLAEARAHLEACLRDPWLAPHAKRLLAAEPAAPTSAADPSSP